MGTYNPMLQPTENEGSTDPTQIIARNHRTGSKLLWVFVTGLAVAWGVSTYFGYSAREKQTFQLSQLLASQSTISALGQRVDFAEAKLREFSGGWQAVGQRITKLEAKVEGQMAQTRRYAETLGQQLHQQISSELEARTSLLDARIRQVESEQTDQRSQMAKVEADLQRDIKLEVASVREEMGSELSGVREKAADNSREVSTLSQRLDRDRIDFELNKGQAKELVPGISLRISGTNPMYQRYRGSLWLLQDRRTLWLRDQSVHETVRFFSKETAEPYELVLTDVTKKAAVGYLLVPAKQTDEDIALPGKSATLAFSDHE